MPDSAIIHRSGDWAHHNGSVAAGALLRVFDSGTSNLASIYLDKDLNDAAPNPLVADAGGLVPIGYIGAQTYKVRLTTSGGTLIAEDDDIPGALDTAPFLAGEFAKPDEDMAAKTGNYTVVEDDLGTIINCDPTGGSFDITLLSAVTAGNGKGVTVRHVGSAGTVGIVTTLSQTITSPTTGVTTTSLELIGYSESLPLKSDGANWHMTGYAPPFLRPNTPGVILIADRVSSAPSSSPGTRYIVSAAFSTFEQEDIIEDNGQGGFIEITPPMDCGWIAYVQDEDTYYAFIGSAWVANGLQAAASDTQAGRIEIAVQSEMEAASSALLAVTPGRQHFHPGHPKAGGTFNGTGTPAFAAGDYGMGAITDGGMGNYTLALDTAFGDANYWVNGWGRSGGSRLVGPHGNDGDTKTTSSFQVRGSQADGGASPTDLSEIGISFWGDYA
jgi:hypothetical protein